jgi:hypothetical protein
LAITAILVIASSSLFAQEVSKEFKKEYDAQQGNTLELNNKYGDIIVTTGNDNKIVVNVLVTLSYPDQEMAEKLISYINVEFTEFSGNYSVKTVIDNKFNFSGWGRTNKKFDIKYTVSAPSWIDLSVINKYGNVEVGQLDGRFVANVQYGDLTAFGLSRGNVKPVNNISISYGKAEIIEAGWLDFTARYSSDITIDRVQAVAMDTKYSKINVNNVSSVVIDSRYDKYNLGNVNNMVVSGGYTDFDVVSITKKLDLECKYGSFRTGSVSAGFEQIDINTSYMGVSLMIDRGASYGLDARVSYGKIEFDDQLFDRQKQIINNTSTELEGTVNPTSNGQAGKVFIQASYGNIKLN